MNRSEFNALVAREVSEIMGISDTKGHDISGDEDVLSALSRRKGLTERQVWYVLASKHWFSIETWQTGADLTSEAIEGRIRDLILYLFLALALIEDTDPSDAARREAVSGLVGGILAGNHQGYAATPPIGSGPLTGPSRVEVPHDTKRYQAGSDHYADPEEK